MTPATEKRDRTVGVVLAGGAGARIGGSKPLRDLAGRTLIGHVIDRLAPQVDALWISARGNAAMFEGFGIPIVEDQGPEEAGGALAAIMSAIAVAARERFDFVATAPCDVPFVPTDVVARLRDHMLISDARGAVVSAEGRLHPTIGLWRPSVLGPLQEVFNAGERRLGRACEAIRATILDASRTGWESHSFLNVNTEEELKVARDLFEAGTRSHPPR